MKKLKLNCKNEKVKVGKWKKECESEKISVNKAHKARETTESTQTEMMVSVKWKKKNKERTKFNIKSKWGKVKVESKKAKAEVLF